MSTSTAKSPPKVPPLPSQSPRLSPGEEVITAAIREAQAALWRAELSRTALKLVIAALVAMVGWAIVDQWVWSPGPLVRLAVLLAGAVAVVAWVVTRVLPLLRSRVRADYAAHSIEHDLPELRHALTSYVSLQGDAEVMGPRGAIVRSIGARAAGQMKQHRLEVPSEATGTFSWWIALAVALAVAVGYALLSPKNTLQSAQRLLLPLARIEAPTRITIDNVQPGDCEVLADRPLEISAEIIGLASRDEPSVFYGQGFAQRQPLQLDASTGRFTATIRVPRSTQYRIAAGDALAGPFEITARDVPVASVGGVHIVPPAYTQLPARRSTGGAVTAEENSQVTITATINRPIERARLEFNPRKTVERSGPSAGSVEMQVAADGLSATATVPLRLPRDKHAAVAIESYRVRVWDAEGNDNPDPIVYPVRVIPDLSPEVNVVSPREVTKEVPINSQQLFEIAALDPDYGLRRIELTWQRGIDMPVSEILWSSATAIRGNQVTEYRFRPESLGLRVGDKLLVSAIAIDNREDLAGQPAANHSQTQPIELLIVAAQPLPPVNAPEDGLSEPDDEPASGGKSQSNDSGGEGADGDGQAGGGSAGGDDAPADAVEQQGGSGSGSGQGNDQNSPTENQENQSGGSGTQTDPSNTDGGQSQGSEQGGAASGNNSSGDNRQTPQSTSTPDPSDSGKAGESTGGDSAEPQASNGAQTGDATAPTAGNDRPSDGSGTGTTSNDSPSDGQRGEHAADEAHSGDATGSGSRDETGSDAAGQDGNGQSSSDAEPSARDASVPPQHDGDAFERIRDYLNQKQQPPTPPGQSPESPAGQDEPARPNTPAGGPSGEQAGLGDRSPKSNPEQGTGGQTPQGAQTTPGDESSTNQTTADSGEPDPARPTDGEAADPAADDAGSNSAAGENAPPEPGQRPQPGGEDAAAEGDTASATNSDSNEPADTTKPPTGSPRPDDGAQQNGKPAGDGTQQSGGDDAAESGAKPPESSGDGQPRPDANSGSPSSAGGEQPGDAPGQASGGDGGDASVLGEGGQGAENPARPPDPIDLEHARQATDLVLDYLEQHRDTPDPELLERLNWTPEELRDFTDRWRELLKSQPDSGSGNDAQQVEETLRSLGIRKPAEGPIGNLRDRDDALRGLRDGGNRPPPPTLYRDAFDAFRRGLSRP